MLNICTDEEGIQMIIDLQATVGIAETEEQAKAGWESMPDSQKLNTMAAHAMICGNKNN